jgi:replicative DNA helicase
MSNTPSPAPKNPPAPTSALSDGPANHLRLLASLVRLPNPSGTGPEEQDYRRNYVMMAEVSDFRFELEEDEKIWGYLSGFYDKYGEVARLDPLLDSLQEAGVARRTLDRLEAARNAPHPVWRSEFEELLKRCVRVQREQDLGVQLQRAARILREGALIKDLQGQEVFMKGYQDSMRFLLEQAPRFLLADGGQRTSGELREDVGILVEQFEQAISNPDQAWGRATGLEPIDKVCRGVKGGEFWIHAGFTGELKTTFALNWAYKTACVFKYNVLYFSLEMSWEQTHRNLALLHSGNPVFVAENYPSLSYRAVRDGVDSKEQPLGPEVQQYFKWLMKDLQEGAYGRVFIEAPTEPITIKGIRQRAEVIHRQTPVHMIIIDHLGLVMPEKRTNNHFVDLNSIMRDAKLMSLHFNHGEKIPVLGLLQINRNGKAEADKADGVYKMQALADANEAERSGDVITYTYLNPELRQAGQVKVGCLKNRDNPLFQMFTASIDWDNKYLGQQIQDDADIDLTMGAGQKKNMPDISILDF